MTSLSTTGATAAFSPRIQMNKRIESAVAAGTISTADQTALGKALDSIDSTLSASGGAKTASGSIKDRMDSLVDAQVASGTLTDDQAAELKQLFAQGPGGQGPGGPPPSQDGAADGDEGMTVEGMGATRGARGMGGPGGPPPGPPPSDKDSDAEDATASTSDSTGAGTSIDDQIAALSRMLDTLRQSLAANGTYGSGTSGSGSGNGLIFSGLA